MLVSPGPSCRQLGMMDRPAAVAMQCMDTAIRLRMPSAEGVAVMSSIREQQRLEVAVARHAYAYAAEDLFVSPRDCPRRCAEDANPCGRHQGSNYSSG